MVVTVILGLAVNFQTFFVVLKWWNGMYTAAYAPSSDEVEAAGNVFWLTVIFTGIATAG
jgi:hypothetical protein